MLHPRIRFLLADDPGTGKTIMAGFLLKELKYRGLVERTLIKIVDTENLQGSQIKLLIFTESKDTLDYLVEKLRKWGYRVTFIHGGMNLDQRIRTEDDFRNQAQVMYQQKLVERE